MPNQLLWLGKKEEVNFLQHKFNGKLAGKAWKYSQHLNNLIMVRVLIFLMSALVWFPVILNFMFNDIFSFHLFYERIIACIILIISGFIFNENRTLSIIISIVVMTIIISKYFNPLVYFDLKSMGFPEVVLVILISGLYFDSKLQEVKKELESTFLENQLIE